VRSFGSLVVRFQRIVPLGGTPARWFGALGVRAETWCTFSGGYRGGLVRCSPSSMTPHRFRGRACQPPHGDLL